MIIQDLYDRGLIHPPKWLADNVHYVTEMGSIAYGASTDRSDIDLYGFCVPPKEDIFPHLRGEIVDFGRQKQRFAQWQEHHIQDGDLEYDITIYNIVKYVHLCMENNPNMVDSLFTPHDCVQHITPIGQLLRDNRKMFLHKGFYHKCRGYAYSQLNKMSNRTPKSKRYWMIEKYGFDIKYASHVIRLLCEAEQALTTGDLDLRRDAETIKAVKRGEWSEQRVRDWFADREHALQELYETSDAIPYAPDEDAIKQLLLRCLEMQYGDLSDAIHQPHKDRRALLAIRDILDQHGV